MAPNCTFGTKCLIRRVGISQVNGESQSPSSNEPTKYDYRIAYAGFGMAGLLILVLVVVLLLHRYREKRQEEREEKRESAFWTINGAEKEDSSSMEGGIPQDSFVYPKPRKSGFSRANFTASIVMPAKSFLRPTVTREDSDTISFYEEPEQGDFYKARSPFHYAPHGSSSTLSFDSLTPSMDYRFPTTTGATSFSPYATRLSPASPSPGNFAYAQ